MTWARRHWLWLVALVPAGGLVWLAWAEWLETGRRYVGVDWRARGPRCLP